MNILVTGGAGYIGSHVVKELIEKEKNHTITIIDNLSTGEAKTIQALQKLSDNVKFVNKNLSDWTQIDEILKENNFDAIIHFAASLVVPESLDNPMKYYLNNTVNSINLISLCNKHNINKFIFSSTAAVYGEPNACDIPVKETTTTSPINPYGQSKLFVEKILIDNAQSNKNFKYVILRYFNVAGASMDGIIGQNTKNATHLIKVAAQTALKKRDKMYIFGDTYDTKDGTCIRDYIHIEDLSNAHILSLKYLKNNPSDIFNVGYGKGFSVKEVIQTMKDISKNDFTVEVENKREGDPEILISNNEKITTLLKWKPKYDDLKIICETSLKWESKI
jgi:UDP-glucose 4-epimerase